MSYWTSGKLVVIDIHQGIRTEHYADEVELVCTYLDGRLGRRFGGLGWADTGHLKALKYVEERLQKQIINVKREISLEKRRVVYRNNHPIKTKQISNY